MRKEHFLRSKVFPLSFFLFLAYFENSEILQVEGNSYANIIEHCSQTLKNMNYKSFFSIQSE